MKKSYDGAKSNGSDSGEASKNLDKPGAKTPTVFDRAGLVKGSPAGKVIPENLCSNCSMGPCVVDEERTGICGATAGTVAAWNFARHVAAGAAAGFEDGREMARLLGLAAADKATGLEIRDESKLAGFAGSLGIETSNRDIKEIAGEVSKKALSLFGSQSGEPGLLKILPDRRQQLWRERDVFPEGISGEIIKVLSVTGLGAGPDAGYIMGRAVRCAIADGWGSSLIALTIRDILFKTPAAVNVKVGLGVLKENEANLVINGHEPAISEIIAKLSKDSELIEYAKSRGAGGINVVGMCCDGDELAAREGMPVAGDFLSQENAVITGAVELMVINKGCSMQALAGLAGGYHTKFVTTGPGPRIKGAIHMEFDGSNGLELSKKIIMMAIENFPERKKDISIPENSSDFVAGFSPEYIQYMLGGKFRGSLRPLNDAITDGRIQGIVAIAGCNNVIHASDGYHNYLAGELIKRDYLVVATGCAATIIAKGGLMVPEAKEYAGDGLKSICEAVGMPPVLHMGSHTDSSRILAALSAIIAEGGLGEDISDLPVVAVNPGWISEREISLAVCAAASGVYTIFSGESIPADSNREVKEIMADGWQKKYKGQLVYIRDIKEVLKRILDVTQEKRKALKIDVTKERALLDMEARRSLKDV
jgi:anaerobic carbon-monoxide dehydrogenase catalytic subunit